MERVLREKVRYPFYVTTTSIELLNKLLVKDSRKRFDVDSEWKRFQKFQFFRHYTFAEIENRVVEPPIRPVITDPELAENFDVQFTSMKMSIVGSNEVGGVSGDEDDAFTGFSYVASSSFVENYL